MLEALNTFLVSNLGNMPIIETMTSSYTMLFLYVISGIVLMFIAIWVGQALAKVLLSFIIIGVAGIIAMFTYSSTARWFTLVLILLAIVLSLIF